MNRVEETIYARKSVRNFSGEKIREEDLKALVKAGIWAPNGMNAQLWHFTVVSEEKLIKRMAEACKKGMENCPVEFLRNKAKEPGFNGLLGAPAAIVISRKEGEYSAFDCGAAAENICLLAKERGLDTCITAMTAFMFDSDPELKGELCIPEDYMFTCAVLIGYAVDGADNPARDRKEDVITYIL